MTLLTSHEVVVVKESLKLNSASLEEGDVMLGSPHKFLFSIGVWDLQARPVSVWLFFFSCSPSSSHSPKTATHVGFACV